MARKGKNKKKKRQAKSRPYNKKQFVEIFCLSCGLCDPKKDPSFCYIELFKHEPQEFINTVWENLQDISSYMRSMGRPYRSLSIEQFRNIFCITGICTNGNADKGIACEKVRNCYEMFRSQMGAFPGAVIHESPHTLRQPVKTGKKMTKAQRRAANKKRRRVVVQAYPSFFISKDVKFQETVKKILHGDNDIKQDKDQESAGHSKGSSGGNSEAGQP